MPLSTALTYNYSDNNSGRENLTLNDKIFDQIIMPYLFGADIIEIKHRLSSPTTPVKEDFQNCPIQDKPKDGYNGYQEKALKILITLGITDFEEQKKYLAPKHCNNVYQLLCHLYRDGHHHLARLIDLIDESAPNKIFRKLALPTIIVTLIVTAGALWDRFAHPQFNKLMLSVQRGLIATANLTAKVLNSAKNVALIGLGINLGQLLYEAILTRSDNKRDVHNKLYDFGYSFLAAILCITSYTITAITNGALSTVAAWLFVASSAVALVKASNSLKLSYSEFEAYKKAFAEKHNGMTVEQARKENKMTLQEKAAYYRAKYHFQQQRMGLMQEIATAAAVVLVIACWSFAIIFPPASIGLIASSVALLTLIQTVHSYSADLNKSYYSGKLQHKLSKLDQECLKNELQPEYDKIPDTVNKLTKSPEIKHSHSITHELLDSKDAEDLAKSPGNLEVEATSSLLGTEDKQLSNSSSYLPSWLNIPNFFRSTHKPNTSCEEEQKLPDKNNANNLNKFD